jgi:hypothetical protein
MAKRYVIEIEIIEGYDEFWEEVNEDENPATMVKHEIVSQLYYNGFEVGRSEVVATYE